MHIWQLSLMHIMWLDCGREGAGNRGTWGQVERIKNSYPGEEIILGRLDIFQHIDGYYLGREIYIYVIQNDRAGGSCKKWKGNGFSLNKRRHFLRGGGNVKIKCSVSGSSELPITRCIQTHPGAWTCGCVMKKRLTTGKGGGNVTLKICFHLESITHGSRFI